MCRAAGRRAGAGGEWRELGGGPSPINHTPGNNAERPSLTAIGGVAYVAWDEFDGTNNEIRVSKLNATGTAWTEVGGGASPINQDPSRNAQNPSLTSIGGVPYVAWMEEDGPNFEIRVSRFNGTSWTQVVGGSSPINHDPTMSGLDPSLTSIGGVPYVAWSEDVGTSQVLRDGLAPPSRDDQQPRIAARTASAARI